MELRARGIKHIGTHMMSVKKQTKKRGKKKGRPPKPSTCEVQQPITAIIWPNWQYTSLGAIATTCNDSSFLMFSSGFTLECFFVAFHIGIPSFFSFLSLLSQFFFRNVSYRSVFRCFSYQKLYFFFLPSLFDFKLDYFHVSYLSVFRCCFFHIGVLLLCISNGSVFELETRRNGMDSHERKERKEKR